MAPTFSTLNRIATTMRQEQTTRCAPPTDGAVTTEEDRLLLDAYVRARNARRSSEEQAKGRVSGRACANLRADRAAEAKALAALGDWVEQQARQALASR